MPPLLDPLELLLEEPLDLDELELPEDREAPEDPDEPLDERETPEDLGGGGLEDRVVPDERAGVDERTGAVRARTGGDVVRVRAGVARDVGFERDDGTARDVGVVERVRPTVLLLLDDVPMILEMIDPLDVDLVAFVARDVLPLVLVVALVVDPVPRPLVLDVPRETVEREPVPNVDLVVVPAVERIPEEVLPVEPSVLLVVEDDVVFAAAPVPVRTIERFPFSIVTPRVPVVPGPSDSVLLTPPRRRRESPARAFLDNVDPLGP